MYHYYELLLFMQQMRLQLLNDHLQDIYKQVETHPCPPRISIINEPDFHGDKFNEVYILGIFFMGLEQNMSKI